MSGGETTGATAQTEVIQTLRIAARPETVWRYWTDPRRICDWWGVSAELDPRPGGICCVDLGGGAVMSGHFVELVPFERIVFTFGWEAPTIAHEHAAALAPGSTLVEVTLTAAEGVTVLTLRHRDLPADAADHHRSGWGHFLPRLAQAAQAMPRTGQQEAHP